MLSEFENKIFTLMAEHIKNFNLSRTLSDNLEKTSALVKSTKALAAISKTIVDSAKVSAANNPDLNLQPKILGDLDLASEVLGFKDQLIRLIDNTQGSFKALSDALKQDKRFILLAVMSGVDGRILNHVSPYLIFTDKPENEQEFENWYENAIFDEEFFGLLTGLNEHCFYGMWSNPKVEEFVASGYDKFDIWDNQSAWISAFKNPRFLRYHDDFSFNLLLDEWNDTPVEVEIRKLITNVKQDIHDFSKSILNDYFRLRSREAIEVEFNIKFDDVYLELIREGDEQMPALHNHDQSVEIYDFTNLSDFESLIRFIVSYEK
mgnify:CR=1 FL=1|jgi:hypothetical protein